MGEQSGERWVEMELINSCACDVYVWNFYLTQI